MGSKTLHRRISFWIAVPLFLGTLLTAAVSWFPIYFRYPVWIEDLVQEMSGDEGKVLIDLSGLSANVGRAMTQTPIYYLILIQKFQEEYLAGQIRIKADFAWENSLVNGKSLALGLVTPPDYDPVLRLSYESSIWYLNPETTSISPELQARLYQTSVASFVARPSVSYLHSSMSKVYRAYAQDGLMYMSPAENNSYWVQFEDRDCPGYYDPRCRPWYKQVESGSRDLASLTTPYVLAGKKVLGQTACQGIWVGPALDSVWCIDFLLDSGLFAMFKSDNSLLTYTYILATNGDVYYHPKLNISDIATDPSIEDLEFPSGSEAEKAYFRSYILPLFSSNSRVLTSYYRGGDKMWLAVSPITLVLNQHFSSGFALVVGVVMSENEFQKGFQDLIDESNQLLQLELVVFFCVLGPLLIFVMLMSRYFAISILKPITDLAAILERMNEGDLGIHLNPNSTQIPGEISRLYDMFSKLKAVLRFNRSSQIATNPTEALLHCAQGMQLFTEVHNLQGISVCARNIGRIHYAAGRPEEAVAYLQQAFNVAKEVRAQGKEGSGEAFERAVFETEITLVAALLRVSELQGKKYWNQAIDLLYDIARVYESQGLQAQYTSTLLDIAMAYIQCDNLGVAKELVLSATSLILKAAENWSIPPEILRERALFTEGVLLHSEGRYYESACLLTECIETNDHFDPRIRKLALQFLRKILPSREIDCKQIDDLLEEYEITNRDVVFVVDYSASMAGIRIHRVLGNLIRFFEKSLKDEDRVSMLTVNRVPRTAFNLIEKGQNTAFLKFQILKATEPRGGTALYDGLRQALKQFSVSAEKPQEESELLGNETAEAVHRSNWIVALFDGEDNCSKTSLKRVRKLLVSSGVNLVFLGLFLSPEGRETAKSLCDATPKGLFLDCSSLTELDTSFQAMTRWLEPAAHISVSSSLFALSEV